MKNVEYQENIIEEGAVKIHHKNIKSDVIALDLCNIAMNSTINNSPDEKQTNIFNLKVYKNGIVALNESLTRTTDKETKTKDEELFKGYDSIINLLEKFIRPKNDAEHYYQQGQRLYMKGEYKTALISFEEAINIITRSIYYHCKGKTLVKLKKIEEASQAFDKAIELDPDNEEVLNAKGYTLASLEQHNEAIRYYNRAIELKPDYAEAYSGKGYALNNLERYEEAIVAYNKAIRLKPDYAEAYYNKGNALGHLERYEEAIVAYDQAIELKPDYATAYKEKETAFHQLGRCEEAIVAYDKAIELKCKPSDLI